MHPLCSIGLSRENHGCRFEGIANSILQGNGAQNLESWQNRLLQNAQSSASLNALGILHGRLVSRASGLAWSVAGRGWHWRGSANRF